MLIDDSYCLWSSSTAVDNGEFVTRDLRLRSEGIVPENGFELGKVTGRCWVLYESEVENEREKIAAMEMERIVELCDSVKFTLSQWFML